MTTKVEIIGIDQIQNKEMEISKHLKRFKGYHIESIELDDKGNLAICYDSSKPKSSIRYAVKQVSKKKYKSSDEFLKKCFCVNSEQQSRGVSKSKVKWIIDVEKVWLIFFEC